MTLMGQLQDTFGRFNGDEMDEVVNAFARGALCCQLNSGRTVTGRREIRRVLRSCRIFLEDLQVHNLSIEPQDGRVDERDDATHCYQATLDLTGRYMETIPGLERKAPATRTDVQIPFTVDIWLDELGLIVRVDIAFDLKALQQK